MIGTMATRPDELSNLPDGVYVYLNDAKDHFIYSIIVPDLNVALSNPKAQYLATHPGLLARLKKDLALAGLKKGPAHDPLILGAGQFTIENRRARNFTNQANSFHGTLGNLEYSGYLAKKRYGLPIENKTQWEEWSTGRNVDRHKGALKLAKLQIELKNNPTVKKLTQLNHDLYRKFPDPNEAGTFNIEPIRELIQQRMDDYMNQFGPELEAQVLHMGDKSITDGFSAISLLDYLQRTGEHIAYVIVEQEKQINNLEEIIQLIEETAKAASHKP